MNEKQECQDREKGGKQNRRYDEEKDHEVDGEDNKETRS